MLSSSAQWIESGIRNLRCVFSYYLFSSLDSNGFKVVVLAIDFDKGLVMLGNLP